MTFADAARALAVKPTTVWTNPDGRVTLRTLILIRWIAVFGQTASVITVHGLMGLQLPIGPVMAAIGASVLLNLVAMAQRGGRLRLTDRDASLYLAYDMLQLTLLLYLTGGLANPFALLLLAPMTVAAAILSRYSMVLLTGLNLICLTVLALWSFPLPWPDPLPAVVPLYAFGIWLSLSVSASFIAGYVFRVAEEARQFAEALAATQVALAREQRLSSLGALAAAAAHELGTPLGTIALVAKEIARDLPPDSDLIEDVALLQSQSARCRDILADLARKPEADGGDPFEKLAITALLEVAGAPHRLGHIDFVIMGRAAEGLDPAGTSEPVLRRSPEILHGLGNYIQNAHQFAKRQVSVTVEWNKQLLTVIIRDDGPGYPPNVLARIGEPYLSARNDRSGHMGLGVFIAQTLLEKTGASVSYANNRGGGAKVIVVWQRITLETEG